MESNTNKPTIKLNSSLKAQEVQKKSIFKPLLTNPYSKRNAWPRVSIQVQNDLLQALETNILPPIKQWNLASEDERKTFSNFSDDHLSVVVGFNPVMEALEHQIQTPVVASRSKIKNKNMKNKKGKNKQNDQENNEITMLFVCKHDITSSLLYMHIPTLCQLANVKLIQLPKGSSSRLGLALGISRDVQFLGLRKKLSDQNKFVSSTVDSAVENVKVGFLDNCQKQYLNMNVKFVLTEMPIKKKQDKQKGNKKEQVKK